MPFTPLDIFATGPDGIWLDFDDIAVLWQDTARTLPVTATNQQVRGVTDKSGNNRHFAFSGGTVPTYQVDANGHGYLNFAAGALTGTGTLAGNVHTVGIANQHTGADTSGMVYDFTSGTSDRAGFRDDTTGTSFGWYDGAFHTTGAPASAAVKVLVGTLDKTTAATSLRENTVAQSGTLNLSTNTNQGIFLGARQGNAAAPFNGNVYQVVHISRTLTTTELSNLESFLASKSGVVLPSTGVSGTETASFGLLGTTSQAAIAVSAAGSAAFGLLGTTAATAIGVAGGSSGAFATLGTDASAAANDNASSSSFFGALSTSFSAAVAISSSAAIAFGPVTGSAAGDVGVGALSNGQIASLATAAAAAVAETSASATSFGAMATDAQATSAVVLNADSNVGFGPLVGSASGDVGVDGMTFGAFDAMVTIAGGQLTTHAAGEAGFDELATSATAGQFLEARLSLRLAA